MLITHSNLALTGEHHLQTSTSSQTLLRLGDAPPGTASFERILKGELQAVPAQLLAIETAPASAAQQETPAAGTLTAILEALFGLRHTPAAPPLQDDATPGLRHLSLGGMQLARVTQTRETESCTFAASGNICLADGSTRQFDVGYRMERSEESSSLEAAAFKDPLVLDFGPVTDTLSRNGIAFDIDSDGKTENLRLPTGDAGILFRDLNHNGRADNGGELFGARSGNGFGELANLDGDGNGWIDGGDTAYADLMLWRVAEDGSSSAESLAAAGVGALATASAATPFTLKEDGAAVGQVRASSVWLGEHSGAGVVRQIDVAVAPSATEEV